MSSANRDILTVSLPICREYSFIILQKKEYFQKECSEFKFLTGSSETNILHNEEQKQRMP
jgi:hypothetical protein